MIDRLRLAWYGLISDKNEDIREDVVLELRALGKMYRGSEREDRYFYTDYQSLKALVDSPRYDDGHVELVIDKMIEDGVLESLITDKGILVRLNKED